MTEQEKALYKKLYTLINAPETEVAIVEYFKQRSTIAVKALRARQDEYMHGYYNGVLDAYQEILNLKDTLTKVMRNIS